MQHRFIDRLDHLQLTRPYGHVRKVGAGFMEASGPATGLGQICDIEGVDPLAETVNRAEVVAVNETGITLVPLDQHGDVRLGARVTESVFGDHAPCGDAFAGRAVDALGRPIDGGRPVRADTRTALAGIVPKPLERIAPKSALTTGVRAIDGLLTLGVGQRIGIFAASGVGKTSLVEQLADQVDCDRCVVCLVGERGREVSAFWESHMDRDDKRRFTLVAATSDESPVLRVRAVNTALALADHWRSRGEHVLLLLDSVTRFAMALREIGLAAGAPPTVRAYTPNVFAALPRLVERCGAIRSGGAITAIMTVLSETDDVDDPIVELMKSLLDGHVILSRGLAERGHFPAIDVVRSISRQASRLVTSDHATMMVQAVALLAAYDESRIMIESGVYRPRSNEKLDRAIAARETLGVFLRQKSTERVDFTTAVDALKDALGKVSGNV